MQHRASEERCRELREALAVAESRLEAKPSTAAPDFITGPIAPGSGDVTQASPPHVREEIERIEQAMRHEGCID